MEGTRPNFIAKDQYLSENYRLCNVLITVKSSSLSNSYAIAYIL